MDKQDILVIRYLPQGGYVISKSQDDSRVNTYYLAAFTTLKEAVKFIEANMQEKTT